MHITRHNLFCHTLCWRMKLVNRSLCNGFRNNKKRTIERTTRSWCVKNKRKQQDTLVHEDPHATFYTHMLFYSFEPSINIYTHTHTLHHHHPPLHFTHPVSSAFLYFTPFWIRAWSKTNSLFLLLSLFPSLIFKNDCLIEIVCVCLCM